MPLPIKNKKAYFDYEVLETYEAGVILTGPEVKSVRAGRINLSGSFVTVHQNKVLMTNVHISHYKPAAAQNTEPERTRELLLNKKEINRLTGKLDTKGVSCVPLEVYTKGRRIKVKIGLVSGKKQYDKRRIIKDREDKRNLERAFKGKVR